MHGFPPKLPTVRENATKPMVWEINTHTFPIVWVLFSYQIPILWYTLSDGKYMGFPINLP